MAKLAVLPHLAIIDGFKGVIDFYLWRGIVCARRWPRSPGKRRSPAVEAQWAAFAYAAAHWNSLSQEIQDAYNKMASGTGLSGRDFFTRGYLTGLYRYELYDEEVTVTLYTARVHKAIAAQTLPSGIDTKITFDTEDWDPDGCFDLPNDKFIAPEAGKYLCNLVIRFNTPAANKGYRCGIKKNGAWFAYHSGQTATTIPINLVLTTVVDCAENDFLEAFGYQNSGIGDDVATGSFRTFFEIHRLS